MKFSRRLDKDKSWLHQPKTSLLPEHLIQSCTSNILLEREREKLLYVAIRRLFFADKSHPAEAFAVAGNVFYNFFFLAEPSYNYLLQVNNAKIPF